MKILGVGVAGLNTTGGKLLIYLIYPSVRSNTKMTTLSTLFITGKLVSQLCNRSQQNITDNNG